MLAKLSRGLILFIIIRGSLFGQEFKETQLPNTPAARQFKMFLQALESGEHEDYISRHFSERFLEAFSLEQHLDFFHQMSMMHGSFKVHTIEASSEHRLVVIAKSQKRDAWRRLEVTTEPNPPYKVAGMGIDVAEPPADASRPAKKLTEAEIIAFARSELQKLVEEDRFSGAVLIAKNGTPLLKEAHGLASKRFNVPNRVDTKFNLGSINKSFTQVAIAQLLEQGKIHLDDRLGKFRPDFPPEMADKITIRHLLTMKSGMGSYWNEAYWAKFTTIKTVEDLIDIIKKQPLNFEPGTRMQYSNSGYVVLGAIIEKVTGESYYDYVREHVFEPAGMHDTDSYELDQIVPNLAIGYTLNRSPQPYKGNKWQNNLFIHGVKGSPAGGGYSTLDDLYKYVQALRQNKLVGAKYTNLVLGFFENLDEPDRQPQGFGFAGGAPVGVNAAVEADFKTGYTVIVLSNYDPPTAEEFASRILRLLLNQKTN